MAGAAAVVVVSAVFAVLASERLDTPRTPDGEVGGAVDLPTGSDVAGRSPPSCSPPPCALWRAALPVTGDVLASAEVVVVVARDQVTALDSATGVTAWTRSLPPPPDEASPVRHVDLVDDRVVVAHSAGEGDGPSRVVVLDSSDGSLVHDIEVEVIRRIFAVGLHEGRVLVFGTATSSLEFAGSPSTVLLAHEPDGSPTWVLGGVALPGGQLTPDPLLVRVDGELARLDPATGVPRWSHPAVGDEPGPDGQRLLITPGRDRVVRVDVRTGEVVGELAAAGITAVHAVGPWIAVRVGDDVRLMDDTSGAELDVRHDAERHVTAVELGDVVVVAWGEDDQDVEVAVHRRSDGSRVHSVPVETDGTVAPLGLAEEPGDPAARAQEGRLVVLRTDHGATLTVVDVSRGAVARQLRLDVPGSTTAGRSALGDLVEVRELGRTSLVGPDGTVHVEEAERVDDAGGILLAHGPAGLLRVDRAVLDGRAGTPPSG